MAGRNNSGEAASSRRIVFFIGAGASVAVGAVAAIQGGGHLPCPTQKDFWSTFLRFCVSNKNRKLIESFLFRNFLGYRRFPSRRAIRDRREQLNTVDVEEVFTFLSERISAPATSSQLRTSYEKVWDALIGEIGNVFSRYSSDAKTTRMYNRFMERHVRSWDTVVSFNYDIVFEKSIGRRHDYYYEGVQNRCGHAYRLIKPHGSINWEKTESGINIQKNPARCLVVAPTHLKFIGHNNQKSEGFLDQSSSLSDVWKKMEDQMKKTKALVFIGYSFPLADLYFSSVLRTVLASRESSPRVVIVNPDAVAIRKRLKDRFSLSDVDTYFDFEQFVHASRRDLLKAVSS